MNGKVVDKMIFDFLTKNFWEYYNDDKHYWLLEDMIKVVVGGALEGRERVDDE